jgi:putative membrane protein
MEASDSRSRDHLANERTYLAWVRTAANVMVLGLAIAKLVGNGNKWNAITAGLILVATGAAGVVFGTARYRRIRADIDRGSFGTVGESDWAVMATAVLLTAIVVAFVLLLV